MMNTTKFLRLLLEDEDIDLTDGDLELSFNSGDGTYLLHSVFTNCFVDWTREDLLSCFDEAYTALRDSNLKLWDFNFSRKGYSLAGDTTLEILNVKPLVTPYALRFNILRSNNVLNISSKVAPVGGTKDYTIELDFRYEGTTNNKVIIDMENLSGWNVEIIFGDFCRDNEVDIINVKDDRNVIADYYLSENSVRVENIVKVNGIRKL